MTTPCNRIGCERSADITYGRLVLCAHHYKQTPEASA